MSRSPMFVLLFSLMFAGSVQAASADHVHVRQGWIRLLPGDLPAGGYAELQNDGDVPATVQAVNSPDYGGAMLHHSSNEGGMSRMAMVDRLDVPAHGRVQFSPGGYHVMLMSPTHPLKVGDTVTLHFVFADGSQTTTAFAVRAANAVGPAG